MDGRSVGINQVCGPEFWPGQAIPSSEACMDLIKSPRGDTGRISRELDCIFRFRRFSWSWSTLSRNCLEWEILSKSILLRQYRKSVFFKLLPKFRENFRRKSFELKLILISSNYSQCHGSSDRLRLGVIASHIIISAGFPLTPGFRKFLTFRPCFWKSKNIFEF